MSTHAQTYKITIRQATIGKLVQIRNGQIIVNVTIFTGDVTELQTDAIAVSEAANFNSQTSLARHVLKRGGSEYMANKMGLRTSPRGRVKSCAAGSKLPCDFVYHVVVPTSIWTFIVWNNKDVQLGEVVRSLFETVARDGKRSIALPLLGSGNAAFHPRVCARVLADALCHLTVYEDGNHSLKSVYIVNISPEMTEVVLQEFEARVNEDVMLNNTIPSGSSSPVYSSLSDDSLEGWTNMLDAEREDVSVQAQDGAEPSDPSAFFRHRSYRTQTPQE